MRQKVSADSCDICCVFSSNLNLEAISLSTKAPSSISPRGLLRGLALVRVTSSTDEKRSKMSNEIITGQHHQTKQN